MDNSNIFDDILQFPDPESKNRFNELVGLDRIKDRLIKEARLLLNPDLLQHWSKKHHGCSIPLINNFNNRTPLFIFGGDVGTGKTTLAESFGDQVARQDNLSVFLYRLSLNTRGAGAVGEMTKLLTLAFKEIRNSRIKGMRNKDRPLSASILLIDEADALAQSREFSQMHHEDRAGVNALIRGIDNLAIENIPALIVMCTNRISSLDPALKRRAAEIFIFTRPNDEQRTMVLEKGLAGIGFTNEQVKDLVTVTGPNGERSYGFTYSDISRRFLPSLLIDAFPDRSITFHRALDIAKSMKPTPIFQIENNIKII